MHSKQAQCRTVCEILWRKRLIVTGRTDTEQEDNGWTSICAQVWLAHGKLCGDNLISMVLQMHHVANQSVSSMCPPSSDLVDCGKSCSHKTRIDCRPRVTNQWYGLSESEQFSIRALSLSLLVTRKTGTQG